METTVARPAAAGTETWLNWTGDQTCAPAVVERPRTREELIGALGAIYSVTLRAVPAFTLHRVDTPRPLEEVLDRFNEFAERNDHFEFFVFPHTETALTIERNRSELPPRPRTRFGAWVSDVVMENTVGDLALRLTRRPPALIPRLSAGAARMMSQGER